METEVRAIRFPEGTSRLVGADRDGAPRSIRRSGSSVEMRLIMYLNTLLLLGILAILLRGVF